MVFQELSRGVAIGEGESQQVPAPPSEETTVGKKPALADSILEGDSKLRIPTTGPVPNVHHTEGSPVTHVISNPNEEFAMFVVTKGIEIKSETGPVLAWSIEKTQLLRSHRLFRESPT